MGACVGDGVAVAAVLRVKRREHFFLGCFSLVWETLEAVRLRPLSGMMHAGIRDMNGGILVDGV